MTQARPERAQGYRAALLRHGVSEDQLVEIVAAQAAYSQDVAIAGHDDVDMAAFVDPPLTTFRLLHRAARTRIKLGPAPAWALPPVWLDG